MFIPKMLIQSCAFEDTFIYIYNFHNCPNRSHCVVSAVLEPEGLAGLHDAGVDVERELVGDVEDVAQLPGVRHVHRQNFRRTR